MFSKIKETLGAEAFDLEKVMALVDFDSLKQKSTAAVRNTFHAMDESSKGAGALASLLNFEFTGLALLVLSQTLPKFIMSTSFDKFASFATEQLKPRSELAEEPRDSGDDSGSTTEEQDPSR